MTTTTGMLVTAPEVLRASADAYSVTVANGRIFTDRPADHWPLHSVTMERLSTPEGMPLWLIFLTGWDGHGRELGRYRSAAPAAIAVATAAAMLEVMP